MFEHLDLKSLISSIDVKSVYRFKISTDKDRTRAQKKITRIMGVNGVKHSHYEYNRAIGNGMAHGKCPVKCKVYVGSYARLICVIKDVGDGFDYQEVIQKFGRGEVYYHHKGFGFRSYANNDHLSVDWKSHGRKIVLFYH
jgi:hypothetical protein